MIKNQKRRSITSVVATTGESLTLWSSRRRAAERRSTLDELGVVDGVRFGVKLVVGLGPQTRFRLEWWHRLVTDMQRNGQHQVVLGRDQVEWLLAQAEPERSATDQSESEPCR